MSIMTEGLLRRRRDIALNKSAFTAGAITIISGAVHLFIYKNPTPPVPLKVESGSFK